MIYKLSSIPIKMKMSFIITIVSLHSQKCYLLKRISEKSLFPTMKVDGTSLTNTIPIAR